MALIDTIVSAIIDGLLSLTRPSTLLEILIFIVIVLSLNMEYGWTGIPNFGKVAFVSLGGLAAALTLNYVIVPSLAAKAGQLPPSLDRHAEEIAKALREGLTPGSYDYTLVYTNHIVPLLQAFPQYYVEWLLVSMALAIVLGLVFALIVSYAVVRLREDYLAIALLMGSFFLWVLYNNVPQLMGGTFGIVVPIDKMISSLVGNSAVFKLSVAGIAALLSFVLAELMLNSPFGRVLRAVRDDEMAAEAMGKNVALTRLSVILASSVWAALGGVLYVTIYTGAMHPNMFRPEVTFWWIAMMLLGGVGNNIGAGIIGVLAFEVIYRIVSGVTAAFVGGGFQGAILNMMVGIIIILVMFLRPRGILPEKAVATPLWDVYEERLGERPPYANPWWRRLAGLIAGRRGKRSS